MKHRQSATGTPNDAHTKKAVHTAAKGDGTAHRRDVSSGHGRDEAIRLTAYAYYEARGPVDGYDLDDWLKAEAQFDQTSASSSQ